MAMAPQIPIRLPEIFTASSGLPLFTEIGPWGGDHVIEAATDDAEPDGPPGDVVNFFTGPARARIR